MSSPNKHDREDWLRGEEPDAQADDFTRHAAAGRQELGSEAEARELLNELDGLLAARFGEQVPEGAAAGAGQGGASQPAGKVRRIFPRYAVAAAILLLLAVGGWWLLQPSAYDSETAFAAVFVPYANELSGRTMGDDSTATIGGALGTALLAYDRRDYPAAAAAFEQYRSAPLTEPAPATAPQIQLYYGISLLGANQPETAQTVLASLLTDATYGHPAEWYHALALLRAGQTTAAHTALQGIAADQSSPFQAQAKDLLTLIPL